jgi:phosphatidylethanolamine/phosphatidyl-N-methylethanolamine N-methyltransferase
VTAADILPFFRAWISSPLRVASVTPSGKALAELITSGISPETGHVLELGAGTGVFTRAMLARGVSESDLTLVEFGPDFARLLDHRFPQARVLWMDAGRLAHERIFEASPVGAVVSGLPLLSMPPRKVMAIMAGSFGYLKRGGSFYQFTYGPRCPVSRTLLDRLGLKAIHIGSTFRNMPPASVYQISRRAPFRSA